MKYYKAFNRDMTCRDFKYEEGGIYEIDEKPILCEKGFHFVKDLVLSLEYYPVSYDITENFYAEVEVLGDVVFEEPTKHKGVTNKLKIVRIIPDDEVKDIVGAENNSGEFCSGDWNSGDWNSGNRNSGNSNSGDWNSGNRNSGSGNSGDRNSGNSNSGSGNSGDSNSGDWNSGNRNSGSGNSGDRNSGYWNSGDRNSGYWNSGSGNSGNRNSGDSNSGYRNSGDSNSGDRNSGNWNSGYRNSGDSNSGNWNLCNYETGCFNTKQKKTIRVFNKKCDRDEWDKAYKPSFLYFNIDKDIGYKKSFQKSWDEAEPSDRERIKDLPNFDADVFYELSGIRL